MHECYAISPSSSELKENRDNSARKVAISINVAIAQQQFSLEVTTWTAGTPYKLYTTSHVETHRFYLKAAIQCQLWDLTRERCAAFRIIFDQLNSPQVGSNQGVATAHGLWETPGGKLKKSQQKAWIPMLGWYFINLFSFLAKKSPSSSALSLRCIGGVMREILNFNKFIIWGCKIRKREKHEGFGKLRECAGSQ